MANKLLHVHHLDGKGKIVKTTPRRIMQRKGYPDLVIKLDVPSVNKFVNMDGSPYDLRILPDEVKAEFAYLLPQEEKVEEKPKPEPTPVPEVIEEEVEETVEESEEEKEE